MISKMNAARTRVESRVDYNVDRGTCVGRWQCCPKMGWLSRTRRPHSVALRVREPAKLIELFPQSSSNLRHISTLEAF